MDELLLSTFRLSIPLVFAAFGGMMSERSGVANIALEAQLLFSAFAGAAITAMSSSLSLGIMSAMVASAVLGLFFASVCVFGRGDQIVVGTALNLFAMGIIPVLSRALFNVTGSTPSLALDLRVTEPMIFFILCIFATILIHFFFIKTRLGLRIVSAGHNPLALSTQGVSFKTVRLIAITTGSIFVSFGGIYLSLCQASGYTRNMSAGRGFMALAALIFGNWKPIPTFLACLFFGLTDAVQMNLQGVSFAGIEIPNQFVQIIPYVVTLLVLAIFSGRMRPPRAINQA